MTIVTGISGCGKTTFSNKLKQEVLSLDRFNEYFMNLQEDWKDDSEKFVEVKYARLFKFSKIDSVDSALTCYKSNHYSSTSYLLKWLEDSNIDLVVEGIDFFHYNQYLDFEKHKIYIRKTNIIESIYRRIDRNNPTTKEKLSFLNLKNIRYFLKYFIPEELEFYIKQKIRFNRFLKMLNENKIKFYYF